MVFSNEWISFRKFLDLPCRSWPCGRCSRAAALPSCVVPHAPLSAVTSAGVGPCVERTHLSRAQDKTRQYNTVHRAAAQRSRHLQEPAPRTHAVTGDADGTAHLRLHLWTLADWALPHGGHSR